MSIIKSIKQVLGLGPAAENHHWDGSVPNQLSLKRGTPEAPGTELIKALNGILSFPNQGQLLADDGYVKLPGGLIIQWGIDPSTAGGGTVTYPIPFPSACKAVTVVPNGLFATDALVSATISTPEISNFAWEVRGITGAGNPGPVAAGIYWIAIGY